MAFVQIGESRAHSFRQLFQGKYAVTVAISFHQSLDHLAGISPSSGTAATVGVWLQVNGVTLGDRNAEGVGVVTGKVSYGQLQRLRSVGGFDIQQELARVTVGFGLHFGCFSCRRRDLDSFRTSDIEAHGGDFIVPVDLVERIQVETEIELAGALVQNLRPGLGAQLGVKRNLLYPAQVGLNDQGPQPTRDLQFRKDTRRYGWRRRNPFHVEIFFPGGIGNPSDQLFQVFTQRVRLTPDPGDQDLTLGIQDKLRVRHRADCVAKVVGDRIAKPGHLALQPAFGFRNVHQPLVVCKGSYVTFILRMSQSLVHVIELHTSGRVVEIDRLHLGEFAQKGRSGEAAEYKNGVASSQLGGPEFFSLPGEQLDIRDRISLGEVKPWSGALRRTVNGTLPVTIRSLLRHREAAGSQHNETHGQKPVSGHRMVHRVSSSCMVTITCKRRFRYSIYLVPASSSSGALMALYYSEVSAQC